VGGWPGNHAGRYAGKTVVGKEGGRG
jgi:hypothetical protein